jgi:hypothetical protein
MIKRPLTAAKNYQREIKSVGFSFGESIYNGNLPKEDCFYPLEKIIFKTESQTDERTSTGIF